MAGLSGRRRRLQSAPLRPAEIKTSVLAELALRVLALMALAIGDRRGRTKSVRQASRHVTTMQGQDLSSCESRLTVPSPRARAGNTLMRSSATAGDEDQLSTGLAQRCQCVDGRLANDAALGERPIVIAG